jgi:hypothetical protein
VSLGRERNSRQVQEIGVFTAPLMAKLHCSSGMRGVGPAERTGKSEVTYWPGGMREGSAAGRRRPPNPRETGGIKLRWRPPAL